MLLNPSGYLPWAGFVLSKEAGHLVICSLQVLHFLLSFFFALDVFKFISAFIHLFTNIPVAFVPESPTDDSTSTSTGRKPDKRRD